MSEQDQMPETVVIGKSNTTATVYHTAECNNYPDNPREITKESAERRGLRPCKSCHGTTARSGYEGDVLADKLADMDADEL